MSPRAAVKAKYRQMALAGWGHEAAEAVAHPLGGGLTQGEIAAAISEARAEVVRDLQWEMQTAATSEVYAKAALAEAEARARNASEEAERIRHILAAVQ